MSLKFDHVHVRCQNPEAAAKYFIDVFGGQDAGRNEIGGWPIIKVELGGQILCFSPKKEGMEVEPNSGRARYGLYQLGYQVEDMEQTVAELKAKGAEFIAGPLQPKPGLTVAFIKGPENIEVEILQLS